ncbi:MAG: DUF1569 domain-containing protein, partial [Planctomycetota bacterium]
DCESDDHDAIDSCIAMIRRSSEFLGPIEDYPFLNDLDVSRWRDFMWIHASHHLSFLVPNSSPPVDPAAADSD